jgi:NTP pyrophosphatase (non-canonical NTP hydrolase)
MPRNPTPQHGTARSHGGGWHDLMSRLRSFRDARDWAQFHHPKDLAAAISIEAGELQERFLWKSHAEIETDLAQPAKRRMVVEELADVLSFAILLADRLEVDIDEAVAAKLRLNARKYPVKKARGSARKYTELDAR